MQQQERGSVFEEILLQAENADNSSHKLTGLQ